MQARFPAYASFRSAFAYTPFVPSRSDPAAPLAIPTRPVLNGPSGLVGNAGISSGEMVYPSDPQHIVQAIWYVIAMKWWIEPAAVALGIILVIVFIVLMVGHGIRVGHESQVTPTPVPETTVITEVPTLLPETTPETTPPTPEETTLPPTPPPPSTWAVEAASIRDPNPINIPYYSNVYNPGRNLPPVIFQQSYNFNYQYYAVVANILKAPLIIDFAVSPGSSSPIRSFFIITIRDNTTHEPLRQDGYFRTYSAESPKRIIFSSPGTYHINMYGSDVSVSLTLRAPTP